MVTILLRGKKKKEDFIKIKNFLPCLSSNNELLQSIYFHKLPLHRELLSFSECIYLITYKLFLLFLVGAYYLRSSFIRMYFDFFCKKRSYLCLIAYYERCCPQKRGSVQDHVTPVLHQCPDQMSPLSTQAAADPPPAEPPVVEDLHKYLGNSCQCFT